jgi:hypothetical protein
MHIKDEGTLKKCNLITVNGKTEDIIYLAYI